MDWGITDSAYAAAQETVTEAVRELVGKIVKAKVTFINSDGNDVLNYELSCRPGDTVSVKAPLPEEISVSITFTSG